MLWGRYRMDSRENTMSATKADMFALGAAATTDIEGEIRGLVQSEALSLSKPPAEPWGELSSDNIVPLIPKIAAPSIAELDSVIGELQEARTYLQSEGERIRRETARYTQLSQTASESIKIISGAVSEWRQAGHPVPASIKREDAATHAG
jgi:hypothetical protein